ncbi:6-O-methylguanine DNA methyltransferase [Leptospira perolatii]|uniref:methylated-DNA--[protein]-cysteine S-methyltransferase n=1 Tax=Leptospira perolatii TaxID=2023191 RepID=A0A2M9ZS12_9LEPT|nr:methylated-DNA--[protein]-cysteine S-methyltransferase [Leptospira perolatii]PJZ71180.1 6-O-methylguanine DNA methyltransferase [Leptospira perolatii]PJZ74713.1 6-O-methylguanine DNA methyltransferase [Leptospira perolatii]
MNLKKASEDYERIESALLFLHRNFRKQPSLKEVADSLGLSEFHFQRLFSEWVGISPKRFLQFLTKEYTIQLLNESKNLLDTTYEVGLSSPGRLHDLFVSCEAMSPGEFKSKGLGLEIRYGIHPTPFGKCIIGITERGICNLNFIENSDEQAIRSLQQEWENANLKKDPKGTESLIEKIFLNQVSSNDSNKESSPLKLLLRGTNFQIKVWEALLKIPQGKLISYESLAKIVGSENAVRAVGSAVAKNPVAYLIPCHRVIRKMGVIHEYRWGAERKKAILGWEAAIREKEEVIA